MNYRNIFIICLILLVYNQVIGQKISFDQQDSATSVQIVPFIYHRGHIYIQGETDGKKGNMVFDTGAHNFYLDSIYYNDCQFTHLNTIEAILPGAGNHSQNVIVVKDKFNFAFSPYLYTVSFVPIFQLKPILGDLADGIIGNQFFLKYAMQIDYENEWFCLYENIDALNLEGYSKIEMRTNKGKFFIPISVQINDSLVIKGDALLDYGSGGSISFTSSTAKKYHLNQQIQSKYYFYTQYGGVGGESASYDFRAKQLKIANYIFNDVTMDYSEDYSGSLASNEYLGLLGNSILDHFDVVIDFINNDLYLKPNESYDNSFTFSRMGFSYVDRHKTLKSWVVTGLYLNSPAELAGLKIDDQIIRIQDVAVEEIPYDKQSEFLKPLKEVELTVIRNNELKLIRFELKPLEIGS